MKTLIVNAVLKIAGENPALDREGEPTAEEARNNFIRLLIAELFPECPSVDLPSTTVDQLTASLSELTISIPTEEKKKRGPLSEEAKAAMKAKREATIAAKAAAAAPAPAEAAPASPKAEEAKPEPEAPGAPKKERKPRGPMSDEAKAQMKAKREATIAAKKAAAE